LSGADHRYRVLFVCTANRCRSPAAEYLARARLGEESALFRSAGLLQAGESCPSFLLRSLAERAVDAAGHQSYRLDQASLQAADLVLAMEGQHVQRATLLYDAAFPRILPLKEAAELLTRTGQPLIALEELLEVATRYRDPRTYLTTRWDVMDPYGRKLKDYRRTVGEIDQLVESVLGRLA
jgi:protein-tyrosine phosphatase